MGRRFFGLAICRGKVIAAELIVWPTFRVELFFETQVREAVARARGFPAVAGIPSMQPGLFLQATNWFLAPVPPDDPIHRCRRFAKDPIRVHLGREWLGLLSGRL